MLILYINSGTYSLKSTPKNRFFLRHFSWQFYLLSELLADICWGEEAKEIFYMLSSNKPIHHLLDYRDFASLFPDCIMQTGKDSVAKIGLIFPIKSIILNIIVFAVNLGFEIVYGESMWIYFVSYILTTCEMCWRIFRHQHYTYIHNWSLQLFSYNYNLASHPNYVVCVNFVDG